MIEAVVKSEIEKIKEVLESNYYKPESEGSDYYNYMIYADYRDELSDKQVIDIAKNGQETFDEIMSEITINAEDYYYPELIKDIQKKLDRDITDKERDWIQEHVSWSYEEDHFLKQEVDINIMVASPECRNMDFVCDNILNYYSEIGYSNGYKDGIPTESCLLWLARQFKMVGKFRAAVKAERKSEEEISYKNGFESKFINSCMQELYNLPSHMSCLVFLVRMTVKDLIEWHENQETYKGITVPKSTTCGLFDPWCGGGSILEIELPNELTIPKDMIWSLAPDGAKTYGYDVNEVYGLVGSAWNSEVKFKK